MTTGMVPKAQGHLSERPIAASSIRDDRYKVGDSGRERSEGAKRRPTRYSARCSTHGSSRVRGTERRKALVNPQGTQQDDLSRAVEAADRAGSIVTDHVRSIIDAAQTRAAEIERSAQQDAETIRTEAYEAANRVLERIDSLEGRLGDLVGGLRQEASGLSGSLENTG